MNMEMVPKQNIVEKTFQWKFEFLRKISILLIQWLNKNLTIIKEQNIGLWHIGTTI